MTGVATTVNSASGKLRRVVVVDIETAPDPQTLCLLKKEQGIARATWAIQRIETACILVAVEDQRNIKVSEFICRAIDAPRERERADEPDILALIGVHLEIDAPTTTLVSFNGLAHDLPIMRRRAFVNKMSECPAFSANPHFHHEDLMHSLGAEPSSTRVPLLQAAGGLGIPVLHRFPLRTAPPATQRMRKCEVDVIATFLLYTQMLAARRCNPGFFDTAWQAIADHLGVMNPKGEHLAQFVRMHHLRTARTAAAAANR